MKKARRRPGARLGQHFLTGTWAARALVEATGMGQDDTVLEIGPGKGALTQEILKAGAHTIAIEKDEVLASQLSETFAGEIKKGQLQIISGDVRDFSPERSGLSAGKYILAANIPYYITGEIIRQFLSDKVQPHTVAILIQKEVAERIVARDGKESILSIAVKVYGEPKIAAKVSRGNFSPPPSVDSAILVISNISKKSFEEIREDFFFKVLRAGFASKRKKLTSNLSEWGKDRVSAVFSSLGLSENARAEDMSLEQWKKIAAVLQ